MKKITIQDVAKEAGVSITTVSRVMNNNYPVKESTRKKVEKAIEDLKFSPNLLARGLINKTTFTIGVIVPSIANLFFPTVVKGIESYMKIQGYTLLLSDTEGNPSEEKKIVQTLMDRRVDGIIVIDPRKDNLNNGYFEEIAKEVPLMIINGYSKGIRCQFVLNDQEMGTIQAMNHLIEMGHKNIAFLRGYNSYSYDLKEDIYNEYVSKHNLVDSPSNRLVIKDGNSIQSTELSMEIVMERLKQPNPPTALFACNDSMAVGALNAVKKLGLSIPDDLSIIGYDNTIISQLTEPKLSSVDQNMYKLGEVAAKRLHSIIKNNSEEFTKTVIETNLVKRDSVKNLNK